MSHPTSVAIAVPATTANIGPGFDCLGAALTLYNSFTFSLLSSPPAVVITATGTEAARVSTDESNLAYKAFAKLYEQIGQSVPSVKIDIQLGVPLARGLGSSATAIAAGMLGANILAGSPLSLEAVVKLAVDIEGHPDNVVPALMGGCRLAAKGVNDEWQICDIPWHPSITAIAAIPNFELSTAEARRVLPTSYSRADAIFNTAHLGLLLRGLETGNADWLQAALQDRIHQPYRQALIPGYEAVHQAAIAAGAYGLVISGAGPTLLALAEVTQAEQVQAAIATAWKDQTIDATVQVLQIDHKGAIAQF
ncbi:homoserine kinase [Phormidium sp. CLA17]|uniref:homoserine kinase n=1 Tax=Leptolyngbya sp. Cla-17 TaxID=2803751 RepID=UPI001491F90E|nr:homoserine kinase [Leptolyngbya sp. Cla-17]MBM0740271.1 homoserine kinase [Leptolyngbya sp. Cla-17]MBM0745496.1 homoserine kinase [Leptolyngbya sp. Cla-17]